jgi:hypothetical protein
MADERFLLEIGLKSAPHFEVGEVVPMTDLGPCVVTRIEETTLTRRYFGKPTDVSRAN